MDIRFASWLHAWALTLWDSPRDQKGQGTVEYIGTVVMVTLLIAAVALAAKGWDGAIGGAMKKVLTDSVKGIGGNLTK